MPGVLRVDTETTRSLSGKLRMAGSTLEFARRELEQALNAIGQCWGDRDEVALQFSEQYMPPKKDLLKGCDDLGKLVNQLADRVDQAMTGYEHVETNNTYNANGGNGNSGSLPTVPSVTVPDATPVNPSPRGRR